MAQITQKDIYDAVKDLRTEIIGELRDVRTDIEELKDFRSRVYGIVSIISVGLGTVVAWFWKRVIGD